MCRYNADRRVSKGDGFDRGKVNAPMGIVTAPVTGLMFAPRSWAAALTAFAHSVGPLTPVRYLIVGDVVVVTAPTQAVIRPKKGKSFPPAVTVVIST